MAVGLSFSGEAGTADSSTSLIGCDFFDFGQKSCCRRPHRPNNRPVLWQRSSLFRNPLLFVIPSAAEGSAVLQTSVGNVFRQSENTVDIYRYLCGCADQVMLISAALSAGMKQVVRSPDGVSVPGL